MSGGLWEKGFDTFGALLVHNGEALEEASRIVAYVKKL